MHDHDGEKSMTDAVLRAVHRPGVAMRPRWHFVFRAALVIAGAALVTLALLFVASFALFVMRLNGAWFVPSFGYPGVREFLLSLPWLLILAAVAFVAILEAMAKRYTVAYRQPLLYSAFGIIVIASAGGFALARTPLHHDVVLRMHDGRPPFAPEFASRFGVPQSRKIHRGIVGEIVPAGFSLQEWRGGALEVRVTPETRYPFGTALGGGDQVVVFGRNEDGIIVALGVRRIDDDDLRWERRRGENHERIR